ncbi:branched-chain amino acid ABC transporter permease [Agrobacterium sp. BA1120]|uniref:branched-chain amino acid ABC transporter permease n=1 Tax=Agrobacterium sp. BA1120 TaxID=3228927 RepID=UPI00336A847D
MRGASSAKILGLHGAVLLVFFCLQFLLPEYHHLAMTRVMVLAIFAMGYNLLFGYTGLLSLGHALFFASGLYGAGLAAYHLEWSVPAAFAAGIGVGFAVSLLIGLISLRTTGVAFMIVTLMFSQVAYLASLYFSEWTRGEEGLMLPHSARSFELLGTNFDLTNAAIRYNIAFALMAFALLITFLVIRSPAGRVMVAVRENEARTTMLGYNTFALKLIALTLSGTICAMAGAAYALLFAYVGSSFGSIQYSIEALLFTLLGGAGTLLGPILGTVSMFYMIDIASEYTSAYMLVTGIALVLLVLFFPKGILGSIRERWLPWLP